MAKLNLESVTSSFGFQAAFNSILASIEDEFSERVLYRDNPPGEPNSMSNDLDMAGHDVLNAATVSADNLRVAGYDIAESLAEFTQTVDDATDSVIASVGIAEGFANDATSSASEAKSWAQVAEVMASTVTSYTHEGILLESEDTITLPWAYSVDEGVEVYLDGIKIPKSELIFSSPTSISLVEAVILPASFEVVSTAGVKGDFADQLSSSLGASLVGHNGVTVAAELDSLNLGTIDLANTKVTALDLSNSSGATLVGYGTTTVADQLDTLVSDITSLDSSKVEATDLANTTNQALGAALVGRSLVVLSSIKDFYTSPSLMGRTDIVVHVPRYWSNVGVLRGGGYFIWIASARQHNGGTVISPTVPWNGLQATHANYLAGVGETAPGATGYWFRIMNDTLSPVVFGASTASIVTNNKYIFDHFETIYSGREADLNGITFPVESLPTGVKYSNGYFQVGSTIIPANYTKVRSENSLVAIGMNSCKNIPNYYRDNNPTGNGGYGIVAVGAGALENASQDLRRMVAIGDNALKNQTNGRWNIAIGADALYSCVGQAGDPDVGSRNVAVGDFALRYNLAEHNVAIGRNAGQVNVGGIYNTNIGSAAAGGYAPLAYNGVDIDNPFPTNGSGKVGIGIETLNFAYGDYSTAIGYQSLASLKGGLGNSAFGYKSLSALESEISPVGTGIVELNLTFPFTKSGTTVTVTGTTGSNISASNWVGVEFLSGVGHLNSLKYYKVLSSTASSFTFSVGAASSGSDSGNIKVVRRFQNVVLDTNDRNSAFGDTALLSLKTGTDNSGFGANALYNLQTGSFNTALGRSSLRIMVDGSSASSLSNCTGVGYSARVSGDNQVQLGNATTTTYAYGAVQNRSDERDKADIRDTELGLDFIEKLRPVDFKWDYREDYEGEEKDGTKKRNRFHHGLIAQEVHQTITELGVDFGGYQDHSLNGGNDVKSLGYEEFIAPLIRSVQELSSRVKELELKLVESGVDNV